ncbi:MAG: TDP-N-acetylfucosamine:lipid II N-acetylfucosaminyltransferase [Microbacteriaceae bacterium]
MSATIAHLIPDTAFLPFVVNSFDEALPTQNIFYVYGSGASLDRHSLPSHVRVEAIGVTPTDLDRVVTAFSTHGVAISHTMSTFSAQAIVAAPQSTLRVWSGWGGDYYGNTFDEKAGLLGPQTKRLIRGRRNWRQVAERAYATPWLHRLYSSAAAASDIFSAPVPTDYAVFRRRFPRFRGQYHQLNYASVEDTYALAPDHVTGGSILVGNSASPENNHLEMFDLLAQVGIGDRDIVAPLSYGDSRYGDDIVQAGRELFGKSFIPLRDFLSLEQYSALIAQCGVVIMGHRRQQALGNIARASWQGAHLFLDRNNPVAEFFNSIEMPFSTLEDLASHGIPTLAQSAPEIAHSRSIARAQWGRDVVLRNIRTILQVS